MLKICKNCNKDFIKKDTTIKFCSRSCSNTFTNKTNPKRKPEGNCKKCGKIQSVRIKYCLPCKEKLLEEKRIEKTNRIKITNNNRVKAVVTWRQRTKIKALEYKGNKCIICGYNKCSRALVFHHIDSAKKEFSISSVSRSWETIKKELDKCILLCMNCHAEEHYKLDIKN